MSTVLITVLLAALLVAIVWCKRQQAGDHKLRAELDQKKTLIEEQVEKMAVLEARDRQLFREAGEAMFIFYDGNRDLYRVLVSQTAYLPDEASPCIARQMESFLTFLRNLIEGEIQLGHLRADVDPAIAAYNFCALYFYILIGFFRDPNVTPQSAVETLKAMVHQYMQGILP